MFIALALGVDDVVTDVAKLAAERVRRPEVHVQVLRDVGHDDGLTTNPLLLKRDTFQFEII